MIGVIGINHASANLEVRERIGAALIFVTTRIPCLQVIPHVTITTCNRTEWYFSSVKPMEIQTEALALLRKIIDDQSLHSLYTYFGVNCCIHLNRVVAGLDSAFFGETEIQGQIKLAYLKAISEKTADSQLHYLFQKALHAGKIVRKSFNHSLICKKNLESRIVERIRALDRVLPPSILIIGASMINYRICHALKYEGHFSRIFIANRTHEKAQEFAKRFGIDALALDQAIQSWRKYDCIISAVKSQGYILKREDVDTQVQQPLSLQPSLVIDLGVPRNIDPFLSDSIGKLENIDSLGSDRLESQYDALPFAADYTHRKAVGLAREMAISCYKNMLYRSAREKNEICLDSPLKNASREELAFLAYEARG